jgi:hypothetical protein
LEASEVENIVLQGERQLKEVLQVFLKPPEA